MSEPHHHPYYGPERHAADVPRLAPPLAAVDALALADVAHVPLAWDGRLLVSLRRGELVCLDTRDGTRVWRCPLGPRIRRGDWTGGCLLHGEHVVLATAEALVLLDRERGSERGRIAVPGVDPATATIADDTLVARGFDETSELLAVDLGSGRVRWRRPVPAFPAPVAVAQGRVVYGTAEALHCVDLASGTALWAHGVADDGRSVDALGRAQPGEVRGHPIVWRDIVCSGVYAHRVLGLALADGSLRYCTPVAPLQPASLAVAAGMLFSLGAAFETVDAATGTLLARHDLADAIRSLGLAGNFTCGVASTTHVFAADERGGLVALDRAHGTLERIGDAAGFRLGHAPFIQDRTLFALDARERLHAYRARA